MNNKVIYTCLVGGYDQLLQPLVVDASFDYICFSNDIQEEKVGVWEIRPIPYQNQNNARLSRFVKILPHVALPEYEYSLWIDANILIAGAELYSRVDSRINEGGEIYQVNHVIPFCDCTYEEIKYAYLCGRTSFIKAYQQYRHLKKDGFPTHWGLFENNLILRRHNAEIVRKISENWWKEFLTYTKRDQFSLMYVYWINKYRPGLLLDADTNTRNVNFLTWKEHVTQAPDTILNRVKKHIRPYMSRCFSLLDRD